MKVLDWSTFKAFEHEKFNIIKLVLDRGENIVVKGENTGNPAISPFSTMFSRAFFGVIETLIGYFRLFIVATGCPSERRPQKTVIR